LSPLPSSLFPLFRFFLLSLSLLSRFPPLLSVHKEHFRESEETQRERETERQKDSYGRRLDAYFASLLLRRTEMCKKRKEEGEGKGMELRGQSSESRIQVRKKKDRERDTQRRRECICMLACVLSHSSVTVHAKLGEQWVVDRQGSTSGSIAAPTIPTWVTKPSWLRGVSWRDHLMEENN